MKILTAVLMAYVVMVILVSPAVPSPVTTVPSKNAIRPPQWIAPVTAMVATAAADQARAIQGLVEALPVHRATSGSELVDLTTARLC